MRERSTPSVHETVTSYGLAVRRALVAAEINLEDRWAMGNDEQPTTIRIFTTYRGGNTTEYRAVVDWNSVRGWSAGWHENNGAGGTVHDREWLDLGAKPLPVHVANSVRGWFARQTLRTDPIPATAAATNPTAPDAAEELQQLRDTMVDSGLGPAGHKRAAELVLATYGDVDTAHVLAAGQIHATLAAGSADDLAHLENELDAAQHELRRGLAERADLTGHLQHLHALLAVADTKTGQAERDARAAQMDADRCQAQNAAVRELAQALRQEGMPAIARRIEAAMSDADIEVAKKRAAVQRDGVLRTRDGRVVPPPGPIELVDDREWLIEQGSKLAADECGRCGGGIWRGPNDEGPWAHSETASAVCAGSGGRTLAMPKTYIELVGQRVAVLHGSGARTHGFLRATIDDRLCLDDVDETVANTGIDLRIGEVANVAATGPRRDQQPADNREDGR